MHVWAKRHNLQSVGAICPKGRHELRNVQAWMLEIENDQFSAAIPDKLHERVGRIRKLGSDSQPLGRRRNSRPRHQLAG
jgi:hypothetical protein